MQRYISFRAMKHKMRLRTQYFYNREYDCNLTARHFYKFEKERIRIEHTMCQLGYFTYYGIGEPR